MLTQLQAIKDYFPLYEDEDIFINDIISPLYNTLKDINSQTLTLSEKLNSIGNNAINNNSILIVRYIGKIESKNIIKASQYSLFNINKQKFEDDSEIFKVLILEFEKSIYIDYSHQDLSFLKRWKIVLEDSKVVYGLILNNE